MHIITQVRSDERVAGSRAVGEIPGQLPERPHVRQANCRVALKSVGYVIEKDERIVLRGVQPAARERAGRARDVLLVRLPGDTLEAKLLDQARSPPKS
jgi:hypothetical protein